MHTISRRTIFLTAVLLTIASQGANAQETVKIGYAGALSGPVSYLGVDMRRGAEMAVEAINAKGGIRGRKLELVVRDDEHDPTKTVAAYRQLIERQGVIAMVGATNSASMLAVTPLINDQLKIPTICPHTDANDIITNQAAKEGRDSYLFRLGMFSAGQADFLIDNVVKKFGFKKVALLTWVSGWGTIGRRELNRRLSELGMKPVADETFDSSDSDMSAQLLKIRAADADVIVNYSIISESVAIFKSQRKIGGTPLPFVSAWGTAVPALWKAAGDLAEGTLNTNVVTADGPQPPQRQAVIDAYRERFKQDFDEQAGFFGAYDAVNLFAAAMEKAGFEPKAIRDALENLPNFKGLILDVDQPPFTRQQHESFSERNMMIGRWTAGKYLQIQFDQTGPYITKVPGQKVYMDPKTFALK
jgi:branched-chain amino acid transport system substrate-binding protein